MSFKDGSLLQITSNCMGQGDDELGALLLTNYFRLLCEGDSKLKIITFYNSGVKLLAPESTCFEHLVRLQDAGVKLVACKTCLDFFKLTDAISVGTVGTMQDIITLQKAAVNVINI